MINVIDLFAGCGGLGDGFLQTKKFKTLAAVEWETEPANSLRNRLKKKWNYEGVENIVIQYDIQKIDNLLNGFNCNQFGKNPGLKKLVANKNVDLIIGGPPCQAYSMAGRVKDSQGMQLDYRNFLFEKYAEIVNEFKPKAFIFENVEGMLSAKPGGISIIDRVKEHFSKIGYEIIDNLKENALVDLSQFGIPQKRKRVFIFGVPKGNNSRKQLFDFYNNLNEKKTKKIVPASSAFKGLQPFFPLLEPTNRKRSHGNDTTAPHHIANHIPRYHNQRDIEIFKILTKDIESGLNKYTTVCSLIKLYEEQTGRKSRFHKYHVIRNNEPSNTIPAHLNKDGLRHIHPDSKQSRSITVREAARLQTFCDDYEFFGGMGAQYKMVGNAVPPKFAKIVAETILEMKFL